MNRHIGEDLIDRFGEHTVRKLTNHFANATIPGKKFWTKRTKAKFLKEYSLGLYPQESPTMLAQRYQVSLRTIYSWIPRASKRTKAPDFSLLTTRRTRIS